MDDMELFDREYFIQTRREIDTEKRERDHILNIAVVVLGALGFAFVQADKTQALLKQPFFIAIEVSTLVILTSLFWVRWMKLRQIADRWYTLRNILNNHFREQESNLYLESIVTKGFEETRYLKKDLVLCFALSSPIYILLTFTLYYTPIPVYLCIMIYSAIVGLHTYFTVRLLYKKIIDPYAVLLKSNSMKKGA